MESEPTFRTLVVVILCLGSAIRAYYLHSTKRQGVRTKTHESVLSMTLQASFYVLGTALILAYVIYPRLIAWAAFHLPSALRWCGVLLGFLCLPLLIWVHRSLDLNCSFVLSISEDHTLVTHGPYSMVRHPMYAVWYLLHFSLFLITANWLVGLYLFGFYTIPITLRMNEEEAMLIEKFGDTYREYMRRTGRILPRPFRSRNS